MRSRGTAARARDIDVVWVPGAWELPLAARALLATERYDAIVALGAVIRGETPHFDFVAGEASRGLAEASADFDVPIGFGLLTCGHDWSRPRRAPAARTATRDGMRRSPRSRWRISSNGCDAADEG